MKSRTQLYRHYDAAGKLLYVGISLRHLIRLHEHRRGSAWFYRIARVEIQHFRSRELAHAAEVAIIAKEQPRFNSQHKKMVARAEQQPKPPVPADVAETFANSVRRDGLFAMGANLYLRVTQGEKAWLYKDRVGPRGLEILLGAVPQVDYRAARQLAQERSVSALWSADGTRGVRRGSPG